MANYREDIVDIELTSGSLHRSYLNHAIGAGDNNANRFGVRAFRNGLPENLSGTCAGYFIRADGETVVITGTVSGDTAYVDLPETCYVVEGQFSLVIKVSGSGVTGTMRIVDGTVNRTSTDIVVDPGTIIPSIDDLIEAIETAVASIPLEYSALDTSVKKDPLHTRNSYTLPLAAFEQGSINGNTGGNASGANRVRTRDKIAVDFGDYISFTPGAKAQEIVYAVYDNNGDFLYSTSVWNGGGYYYPNTNGKNGYFRFVCRKSDNSNITPSDYDATITVVPGKDYLIDVPCERGRYAYLSSKRFDYNTPASHAGWSRNKFPISMDGVYCVIVPQGTGRIIVCDNTGTQLNSYDLLTTGERTLFFNNETYAYFDIEMNDPDITSIPVRMYSRKPAIMTKRIYRGSGDTIIQDIDVHRDTGVYTNMAYKIPPNYSATGEPVPIVLWIGGNNSYPTMDNGFPNTAVPGVEYIRDEGYAVLQVYSWGSYYAGKFPTCGRDQPYPVPISFESISAGLNAFCEEYNVDADNINIICRSFGGQMGLFLAENPFNGLKSVTQFDPVIDFLSMRGRFADARKALAEELSMDVTEDFFDINEDGSSTGAENYYFSERCEPVWEANMPALIRLNVAWRNMIGGTYTENYEKAISDARKWWRNGKSNTDTTIYNHPEYKTISVVPVLLCGARDDASTPLQVMTEKIEQLRNSGNPAEVYLVPTGGHDAVSVDTTYAEDITTALGILHTDVPIGWIKAMVFIRKNAG